MRYIKVNGMVLWGQDTANHRDLVQIKEKMYDWLIDTVTGRYFDAEKNAWVDIPHDGVDNKVIE